MFGPLQRSSRFQVIGDQPKKDYVESDKKLDSDSLARAVDIIQREYGWKDEYILYELPYARFNQIMRVLNERLELERDRELINQLNQTYEITQVILQTSTEKHKPPSFKQYLRDRNLDGLLKRNFKLGKSSDIEEKVKKAKGNVVDAIKLFSKKGGG